MADLNALIAQGYQFQAPPDPFAQYGKMQQLENSATQNRLAQQQMTENAQLAPLRMREAQAKLNTADLNYEQLKGAQDFVAGVMTKAQENGSNVNDPMDAAMQMLSHPNPKVQEIGKHLAEAHQLVQGIKQQQAYAQGEPGTGAFAGVRAAPAPGAAPMPSQASAPVPLAPAAPGEAGTPVLTGNALAPPSVNAMEPNRLAQIDKRLAVLRQFPKVPEAIQERTDLIAERNRLLTPLNVAAGGSVYNQATGGFSQAPEKTPAPAAPPSMVAEYNFAKTPAGGGYVGSFEKFVRDRAIAARPPGPPRAEPAPSITNIVDPTNPNQMIAIDARRYQGGGVGSPGVIGASGKEPGAAVRTNKTEAGKTQLADDLENLRASFETLDKLRAIPSTERGALSNVTSGIASTAIGQRTGQFFATEAQVERDVINSARSRLVNSIKNATGMSAQQLNSNVELQTMLKSISDPGQSYQSAIRIIEDIENAYVKGMPKPGASTLKPSGGGAPPPPPGFKQDN
jgi:hypothetical protein